MPTPPAAPPARLPVFPRRPRVGVDFHTFDGLFQGSRSHLLGVYRQVLPQAPDIDWLLFSHDPAALRAADPVFRLPHVHCEPLPEGGGLARLLWQLRGLQRRHRLDLLHVQYRGPWWPAGPLAVTVHDTLFETHPQFFSRAFGLFARVTGRRAVRQAACVLSVSGFSRDELQRLYGLPPGAVTLTGNGVDTGRFHPGGWQQAAALQAFGVAPGSYLLMVGRIEPRKNHLGLVRAYAQLRQPRPPLLIVGQRDAGHADLPAEIEALGLGAEVRLLDRVDDGLLPLLVQQARVVVYPSFAEGFGMPVLEAMACGVPVVTSDNTALAEVAGGAALTADPQRPDAIAAAVQGLLDDPGLWQRCSEAGLAVAAQHTWTRPAEALLGAFRTVLAQRLGGRAPRA